MSTNPPNPAPVCAVKDIQFFVKPDLLKHKPSVNKYRTRFDQAETKYLYWDLEIVNLLCKKEENPLFFKLRCTALTTKQVMYAGDHAIDFQLSDISNVITGSWGTPDGGYWVADQYLWEVLVNDSIVFTKTIIVDKLGQVTESFNPYFQFEELKIYPSYTDRREKSQGYRYLRQLQSTETEHLGLEIAIKRKFTEAKTLEFKLNIINALNGFSVVSFKYDTVFTGISSSQTEFVRLTYGETQPGFWKNGTYLLYLSFMDVNIASGQFTVGDTEVEGLLQPIGQFTANHPSSDTAQVTKTALEDAMSELNSLVGMTGVKQTIHENIEYLKFNKLRMEKGFADDGQLSLHSIFTGNPGTGKTTVVRLLGRIYKAMGLLSKGHVVEATRADLVGEFIGQTAPKTKEMITKARGGILFLDEVYALARSGSDNKDYGAEVIEMLLKEMSDGPGDIAIIGAGYPNEVNAFLESNPGLKSRFSQHFHFEDYLPDELMLIAGAALKKEEAALSNAAETELRKRLTNLYRARDKYFGNGRLVFSIIDEAKREMGIRLLKQENLDALSKDELSRIELEDLEKVFEEEQRTKLILTINQAELDEALQQLDNMVGLQQIKQEVRDKINLVRFYSETGKDVLNRFSLHTLMTGNPGTGKTTLARLLGKIYKALGLLERGHVVEVDRQNLVAAYVGQTAIKTADAIRQAMGGVLFIDEAYSLTDNGENDFGGEAIETLLKMMEDHRGKFAVIAAGYPDNMNEFVRSNPGLQSRFDATYSLPDYSYEELYTIAEKQLALHELLLKPEAAASLSDYLNRACENRDKFFGNARFVRQTVEAIVNRQYLRMAALTKEQRTPELLQYVTLADIEQLQLPEASRRRSIGFKQH
ncbi:MAG TPA: AAA family ATPase [Chitinophagaceae bacterium]|nr:AAA family ATPase [Chitinophagaceae bacterium]